VYQLSPNIELLFTEAGPDLADPRLRVVSAVLYLAGLALLVIGSVGAFLWSPVLWCAIVGLVLIAGAFVVAGGEHR